MKLDLSLFSNNSDYWSEIESYVKPEDKEDIFRAYNFAKTAHKSQKRNSGEDYISHPVWVAKIALELNLGKEAVIASLLHDCVEDTGATIDEVANNFGDEVALIVDGLTEVQHKTKDIEVHETNVNVFRQFLFSSVDDVRILIIRIIDKLHNGLTIQYVPKDKQLRYAKRVIGVYGPVAEYVGLHYFKKLLEDIAFEILYEEESEKIKEELEDRKNDEVKAVNLVKEDIEKTLKINNINDYEIQGRVKSLYSTFLKSKKYYGERSLKDRVGIRLLLKNINDCYTVLGLLHLKYPYIPTEFKDYISSPKPNGYRSIQTAIKWKNNITVEIQIRTFEMHEFNEFGPASHIAYKYGQGKGLDWVKDLVNWQVSRDNVNNYQIKVLNEYIYVFTPKGDVIQLQKGATALDFAFRIHTGVGETCKGAKINQKMGKIDTELKTGDVVEIITGKRPNIGKNWLEIVKTSLAREYIKKMTLKDL